MRLFTRHLTHTPPTDGWCPRCRRHRTERAAQLCPPCQDVQRLRWEQQR